MLNKKTYFKLFSLSLWLGNKPVFILLLVTCSFVSAQNLVPNGDFEQYWVCPNGASNLYNPPVFPITNPYSPKYWYDPNGYSSDYFNTCSTLPTETGVPYNGFGYQEPHSGNGYCGFSVGCTPYGDCAEYIATPLISPLVSGQIYCVGFWLALSDSACIANNGIGAYLSTDSITFATGQIHGITPQVTFGEIISDTNWIYLESSFVANGEESYLLISNVAESNYDIIQVCNDSTWLVSYYYIDDVYLTACSYLQDEFEIPNVFTPNNDQNNDYWSLNTKVPIKVTLMNRWGNVIFETSGKQINWDGGDCSEGIYFYKIETENTVKTGFIQLVR